MAAGSHVRPTGCWQGLLIQQQRFLGDIVMKFRSTRIVCLAFLLALVVAAPDACACPVGDGSGPGLGNTDSGDPLSQQVVPEPCSLAIWSLLGAVGIAIGYWKRKRVS